MRREARHVEEFAAALEGRGVSSARLDPALAPLLAVASGLQGVPLAAAPEFRDSLRQRLLAVATVAPAPVAVPSPAERAKVWVSGWRVQRAMAGLAASMAVVVGLSGVSVAASRSVPGDALYGMKRSAEGVQLALSRNDVNRGKRYLQHAETRLDEIGKLVHTDLVAAPSAPSGGTITVAFGGTRSEHVSEALRLMDGETRHGTRLLFDAYTNDRDDDVLVAVREFTERQRANLGAVLDKMPTAAHDQAEASIALVASLNLRATQLLSVGTCGDACAAPKPVAPTPGETPVAAPSPTYDSLGPVPCTCPSQPGTTPSPEPTPAPTSSPEPTPSDSQSSPEPTSSETPQPTPSESHYPLPSQVPSPVASPVQSVVDEVNDVLPTPLPTLPPVPGAPLVPGTVVEP